MTDVRQQYEKHPYPPVPFFALPQKGQGETMRYETGAAFAQVGFPDFKQSDLSGKRILIAGCGTFETVVVAQNHLNVSDIVAVDVSDASLNVLRRRLLVSGLSRRLRFQKALPPIRLVRADLREWQDGTFDYIICSNVIHHVPEPAALFQRMSSWLVPDGILRLVTYPKQSRIWMRLTARWLREQGFHADSQGLVRRAHEAIHRLPQGHPVRSCFLSNADARNLSGLIDAFFHACENPLAPLEWKSVSVAAGLSWIGESQSSSSQSHFLDEVIPAAKALPAWEKLQILDDLLEVCANPILWFVKRGATDQPTLPKLSWPQSNGTEVFWEASVRNELDRALERVAILLHPCGVSAEEAIRYFREDVGPRVGQKNEEWPGLSIGEWRP